MKHLALSWADQNFDDESPTETPPRDKSDNATPLELAKFDTVFHIALRNVKNNKPIEEVIIEQHADLEDEVTPHEIQLLLHKQSNKKVLLLLDGYDEYKKGKNVDIDQAIGNKKLRNCWVILTSRENDQFYKVRDHMEAEAEIKGFDRRKIPEYIEKRMKSFGKGTQEAKKLTEQLLRQAESRGLVTQERFFKDYGILCTPMLLNMICVLFAENQALPDTRTAVYDAIAARCILREQQRGRGGQLPVQEVLDKHRKALEKLGELAWQGLKGDWLTLERVSL